MRHTREILGEKFQLVSLCRKRCLIEESGVLFRERRGLMWRGNIARGINGATE